MDRRHLLVVLAGLFLAVLAPLPSPANAQNQVTLKGTVVGSNGVGKGDSRLEIEPGGYVAVTDRNGRFIVSGLRISGTYTITVRQGGRYETFVEAIGDDRITLNLDW